MMEVIAGDETSEPAAEDGASVVSATESVESGVDLGGGSDVEVTCDILRKGKWGWHLLSSSCRSGRLSHSHMFCCKPLAAALESSAFVTRVPPLST